MAGNSKGHYVLFFKIRTKCKIHINSGSANQQQINNRTTTLEGYGKLKTSHHTIIKLDSYAESAVNDIFNTRAPSNKILVTSLLFHQK